MNPDHAMSIAKHYGITISADDAPKFILAVQRAYAAGRSDEREACAEHYLDICRKAIKEEREACAQVCDAASEPRKGYGQTDDQWAASTLAERIRARSTK